MDQYPFCESSMIILCACCHQVYDCLNCNETYHLCSNGQYKPSIFDGHGILYCELCDVECGKYADHTS